MRFACVAVAVAASVAYAANERVAWEKPETAPAKSQATGKPVLYYFLTTQQTEPGKAPGGC